MQDDRRPGGSLRAADLSRSFDGVQAVQGVSFELHRQEVVGLIGPNGAGKSTLVNLLSGFDFPTHGSVELNGRDITRWSASRRGRHGLARTFQHSRAFRSLSVRENVEVAALGVGASPAVARRRASDLLEVMGLAGQAGLPRGCVGARGRTQARRRTGACHRAVLRPDGRAGSRSTRGGGARVRGRRPLRARRPRRGRPPDRPQHGADHGRLRPHPGARSRSHPRRRHAGRDPRQPRRRRRLPRRERRHEETA